MNGVIKKARECILVVDDCEDNLYLMQLILENQGYKVEVAYNGKQALNKIKQERPKLVLLDLMMPQMNGYEMMSYLRNNQSLSSIPVVFVTANKYIGAQEATAAGAKGIIYKPIDIDILLSEVAKSFNIKAKH
jgi:CheY-like chemotaxis protein